MHGRGGHRKSFKLKRRHSRRMFSKHGSKTHKRNMPRPIHGQPMRGGIRL